MGTIACPLPSVVLDGEKEMDEIMQNLFENFMLAKHEWHEEFILAELVGAIHEFMEN